MNIKRMFTLTQRPEKQKVYTIQETADLLDTSCDEIRRIVNYYKVKHEIVTTKQSRAIVIDYDSFRLVKEIHEEKEKKKEQAKKQKRLHNLRRRKAKEDERAEDHPLVTDKRCLKLSYWPDVITDCFKEVD